MPPDSVCTESPPDKSDDHESIDEPEQHLASKQKDASETEGK